MVKDEILELSEEVLRAGDSHSLDWGLERLLKFIKRNMDETSKALDEDFFPPYIVLPIAQCTREATEFTGISSLARSRVERHMDTEGIKDIKEYADEAEKEAENVPF